MTKPTHLTSESTHFDKLHELLEEGGIVDGVWLHRAIEDLFFNWETELLVEFDTAMELWNRDSVLLEDKCKELRQLKGKNKV